MTNGAYMSEIIYAKYNKLRRKEFRVRTCIYEENGQRWVEKSALCSEAVPHVNKMAKQAVTLKKVYPDLEFAKAEQTENSMRFEYLTGKTLDNELAQNAHTAQNLIRSLTKYFEWILPAKDSWRPFAKTEKFREIFGAGEMEGGNAAAPLANIDCILENTIVNGEKLTCLDYEWVFDFPIPVDFMRYRVVHYFYKAHPETAKVASETEVLEAFAITEQHQTVFAAMERAFQRYVFGGEQDCRYTENYRQPVTTYDQMVAEKQRNLHEIDELRKVVGHYEGVERKLRKIGLWQTMQGVQKVGRKVKGVLKH